MALMQSVSRCRPDDVVVVSFTNPASTFKARAHHDRRRRLVPSAILADSPRRSSHEKDTPLLMSPSPPVEMGVTDTSLESAWEHRMWVAVGCTAMGGMLLKAVASTSSLEDGVTAISAALAAYVAADFATGVYHWGVDNYGDAEAPIFGPQIDAFQGHHKRPWTITKRQFANNIHALARPAAFAQCPFLLLPSNTLLHSFLGTFLAFVVFSQQFHSWAHSKKRDLPLLVVALQDVGILLPRKMHGAHHKSPYNINYCIVSGMWNPLLNETRFFGRMERLIYTRWKVKPRSWSDTTPEWMQDGSYFSDGTNSDDSPLP